MKKTIGVLLGLGICATSFAWSGNVNLSPTPISNPRNVRPNSRDTIHLGIAGLPKGAVYNISCMLSAQKDSKGVYAGFLTRNIGGRAQLMFNGKKVTVNQTVVVPTTPKPLAANNVTINTDQLIVIENRDGKGVLHVGACMATPKTSGK